MKTATRSARTRQPPGTALAAAVLVGLVACGDSGTETDARQGGVVVDGRAYAIPHNHLWYHEIVNLDLESRRLAVTLCPLTGSSLAFDRAAVDGVRRP